MKSLITILLFALTFAVTNAQSGQLLQFNDSISLVLDRIDFVSSDKAIELYDNLWPIAIDRLPIFGADGQLPKYQLDELVFRVDSRKIGLQTDGMYNPWFGEKPSRENFALIIDGTEIRLQGRFSDAAGAYVAEWLIVGNSSIRTILSRDARIIYEYFGKNK